ncbi:SusD/RagB family nutrient-binding outer membrane lipoprotein [Chryseobacterium sp.]|uniref:SusD/RagB family nutrient-binding outer membrane lipoprotein n=1 Tax=Chryseobacterium sp. TaxID=1871047 RepID=UPI00289C4C47|nr:SusD/RagB family nutrient-binding outer membrane lipoprotein [Chryseobacterium sp.]
MKTNKFLIPVIAAAISFSAVSCSDEFLDVNDNPNSIQAEKITPELMFPGAVSTAYRTQAGTMMQFGNLMMNSWAGNSYAFGSPFSREFNLQSVDNTFYTGIWGGLYPRIANFAQIEKYPNADHKQDQYVAMAKIMKAFYMQTIVDLYGDAPYSEAFMGQDNTTPKYDNDEDIYKALIADLEQAEALIKNGQGLEPTSDIVFNGNMGWDPVSQTYAIGDSWLKFSNTIKLRLLVRMSRLTGANGTYRDQKLATLAGAQFIDGNVIVNPGYSMANDDKMNPFILNWARNSAGSQVQSYNLIVPSEHFANAMQGNLILNDANQTKFNNLGDPRRTRLFTSVSGGTYYNGVAYSGLKGVRQGALPGQPGAPTGTAPGITNTSKLGAGTFAGDTSVAVWNPDVIIANNNRGGMIMSGAESNFLQAEAGLRWPGLFPNAQAKFTAGIVASGVWLGVSTNADNSTALMTSYANAIVTRPGLGWGGTDAQKLEAIMTQKWISLTNVNPTEMFIDFLRTGLPYTPMATTSSQPNKPYRLVYPVSEYAANSANVPNIPSGAVFVKNQYTPFWNQ